ncbi:hypothetical protein [Streptosporangium sp. NPDC002721]|uniref:hypothetical protein n=1 Tax=Streptosporangium sp. NPDC002721 TaxID=3366188 RepID=UPI0036AFE491
MDVETLLLCDVLPDGTVAGLALVEPIYDTNTGDRVATRLVDPATGAVYTPAGTLGPCATGGCGSVDTQLLCDVTAAASTPFLRAVVYDCDGAVTGTADLTLDGAPYTVAGTAGLCPQTTDCASPTTPTATVGLCLADGTPIAVTVVRDCDGVVTSEGWINLTTGAFSAGAPPVGTVACGDSQSIQISGTFCDLAPDGTVLGLVLIEYSYAADGTIASVRLVDAVTGATYTPTGTVTVCPAGVEQPEQDLVQLCDVAADGTSTAFVRDYRRDELGAITGHSDYLLDGTAYVPTGTVGICHAECRNSSTVLVCDVPADSSSEITPTIVDGVAADIAQTQFANLAGPYTSLWTGGSLVYPAGTGPAQEHLIAVGQLTAGTAGCEGASGTVTVSVRVTQNGPGTGQLWDGALRIFRGTTVLMDDPVALYAPPGHVQTLTVSASVTAADLVAGDIRFGLALETFHGTAKSWTADEFSATIELEGCEATSSVQFLRTLVTDCVTGEVVSTTDTTLDGDPYTVTGEVSQCTPTEPAECRNCEGVVLCDTVDDAEPHTFLRTVCRDCTGAVISVLDTELDGTAPYAPTGTVGRCPQVSGCASPTTPVAAVGLCLADGTPIAVTVQRDCDGAVISEGWINLTTGAYSAGDPPTGAGACGDSQSVQVSGTFCDIDADGDVVGLVLIEYSYAADGTIDSVRLVDAVTGTTYVPQGAITVCPAGVEQPEQDLVVLCDVAADGTATRMLRDYRRDENGAIVGHSDYTLDGAAYTPTGTVGLCGGCNTTQVCVRSSGRVEFLTNPEGLADNSVDSDWTWSPNLAGPWWPTYRLTGFPGWFTVDGGTPEGTAHWVAPHPGGVLNNTGQPGEGPAVPQPPGSGDWYVRAAFTLPDDTDPASIRISTTALNADQLAVEWRLNGGAWQPVGTNHTGPPYVLAPTAVPGAQAGVNEIIVHVRETFANQGAAGLLLHVIAEYDVDPSSYLLWTQVVCDDGRVYYLDDQGERQDALPDGWITVPCASSTPCLACETLPMCDAGETVTLTLDRTLTDTDPTPYFKAADNLWKVPLPGGGQVFWDGAALHWPTEATPPPPAQQANGQQHHYIAALIQGEPFVADCLGVEPPTEVTITAAAVIQNLGPTNAVLTAALFRLHDGNTQLTATSTANMGPGSIRTLTWTHTVTYEQWLSGDLAVDLDMETYTNGPKGWETRQFTLTATAEVAGCPTTFLRTVCRDCTGATVSTTDTSPDGAAYTPTGIVSVGACPEVAEPSCQHCETVVLCDGAGDTATITGSAASGTLANGVTWAATGATSPGPAQPPTTNNGDGSWWGLHSFPHTAEAPTTWTFSRPSVVEFSVFLHYNPTTPAINTAQLPAGLEVVHLPDGYSYNAATGVLARTSDAAPGDPCTYSTDPQVETSARFRTAGPVTTLRTAPAPGSRIALCGRFFTYWAGALAISPGGSFLRTICRDCDGTVTSVTDTLLDGETPYTPTGAIGACQNEPPCGKAVLSECVYRLPDTATGFDADQTTFPGCWLGTALNPSYVYGNRVTSWEGTYQTSTGTASSVGFTSPDLGGTLNFTTFTPAIPVSPAQSATGYQGTAVINGITVTLTATAGNGLSLAGTLLSLTPGDRFRVEFSDPVRLTLTTAAFADPPTPHNERLCGVVAETVPWQAVKLADCEGVITIVDRDTRAPLPATATVDCDCCQPAQVCVVSTSTVRQEFISNAANVVNNSVDPTWTWSPNLVTWYPMYRTPVFPGWTTVDGGTPQGTAHWVAPHPNGSIGNSGLPGEGPTLGVQTWYARASFNLPDAADPASIKISATALNADQLAVEWRLNGGAWQPVNASHIAPPTTFGPTAVPGVQPGTNEMILRISETVAGGGGAGLLVHLIADYQIPEVGQRSWTRMVCCDDTVYYIDDAGARQDELPEFWSIVACGSGQTLVLCDTNGPFIRHVGYRDGAAYVIDTTLTGGAYVSVGAVGVC